MLDTDIVVEDTVVVGTIYADLSVHVLLLLLDDVVSLHVMQYEAIKAMLAI